VLVVRGAVAITLGAGDCVVVVVVVVGVVVVVVAVVVVVVVWVVVDWVFISVLMSLATFTALLSWLSLVARVK